MIQVRPSAPGNDVSADNRLVPARLWQSEARSALDRGSLDDLLCAEHFRLWSDCKGASPFQHPEWLVAWWSIYGAGAMDRLFLLRSMRGRELESSIGFTVEKHRSSIGGYRRLHLLGQSTWISDASPGEIAEVVASCRDGSVRDMVLQALDLASAWSWDDLRVAYVPFGSSLESGLLRWAAKEGLRAYAMEDPPSHVVDTTGDETDYWHSRSGNARRALLGKRRLVEARGVRFCHEEPLPGPSLETFFELHEARWRGLGLAPRQKTFLRRLAGVRSPGFRLRLSSLRASGAAVSMVLNVESRRTVYYLQSGFRPDWESRVSLGKLHLGYEISAAFASPNVDRVDLLPGSGMRSDYKPAISNKVARIRSLWVPRTARARILVRLRAAVGGRGSWPILARVA